MGYKNIKLMTTAHKVTEASGGVKTILDFYKPNMPNEVPAL